ncbi:hexose transporter Hxt11p [Trichomonascus vanleenenianus]|uniref:hexose transporter Hxt11p n=1 Tax=Trichomonascus vanleenenianus TaxID=2268995 RepID=UPI003ECAE249
MSEKPAAPVHNVHAEAHEVPEKDEVEKFLPDYGRPWYRVKHLLVLNLLLFIPMLSSTTNGYDGSMLNGLQSLPDWQSFFGSPQGAVLGALANGTTFGGIIAFPFASWINDTWGRKWGIFLGSGIIVVGAALQAAAQNYAMFLISRLFLGFGSLIAVVGSPSLISELAYPSHRGVVTAVYNTLWYLGALVAAWVTYGTYFMHGEWSWRLPSLVQGVLPLVQLITTYFVPESPRFLVSKGRYEEARTVLLKYHGGNNEAIAKDLIDFELAEIIATIEAEKLQKETSYLEFIRTKPNRRRLAIITLIPVTMQLCGNGLVSYYLHLILNSIGITSATEQLVINGSLMVYNLGTAVIAACIVGRLPRRTTFLCGLCTMIVIFTIWTVLSAINEKRHFVEKSLGQGVLAMIFLFYAAYNLCLNGLPYLYITEVLPYYLRAKGITYVNLVTSVVLVYNGFVNPVAMAAISWKYYIVFIACMCVEVTLMFFLFPETKGYTLEEVSVVFGDYEANDVPARLQEKREEANHVESV